MKNYEKLIHVGIPQLRPNQTSRTSSFTLPLPHSHLLDCDSPESSESGAQSQPSHGPISI